MKKTMLLILLLIITTIIPYKVNALSEYHALYYLKNINCSNNSESDDYNRSTNVTFENGLYHLSGEVFNDFPYSLLYGDGQKYYYMCDNKRNTECEKVHAILLDNNCDNERYEFISIQFKNGQTYENTKKYYVGKDYTYENGIYTLKDYEEHNFSEITGLHYLSKKHYGYYICPDNYQKSCQNLSIIREGGFDSAGNAINTMADYANHYYLVSDSYKKENNEFILLNPKKVYPASDANEEGFTCKSNDNKCNKLYYIHVGNYYETHDGGRKSDLDLLEITTNTINKEIKLKDDYKLSAFFNEEELPNVFSTNKEVANIVNNELVLYKVGNTDLIYENDFNYKAIHLKVTDDLLHNETIPKNPNTRNNIILLLILCIMLLSIIPFRKKLIRR